MALCREGGRYRRVVWPSIFGHRSWRQLLVNSGGRWYAPVVQEALMKFLVVLEKGEDGYIVAECPALPGCVSQGKSTEEALANIREAIQGIIAVRQKHGLPIPEEYVVEVAVPV